ncbi:MAG TPA: ribonuclease P protein component [Thiothrix sp.]|nr:ribonuclease P protein component [Thiothrix sp.]
MKASRLQGFARQFRLTRPDEFRRVFNDARRYSVKGLLVLGRNNGLGYPRLGFAISKRSIKFASKRNRIKRLARESFRHHKCSLSGIDLVVLGRGSLVTKTNHQITEAFNQLWQKLA